MTALEYAEKYANIVKPENANEMQVNILNEMYEELIQYCKMHDIFEVEDFNVVFFDFDVKWHSLCKYITLLKPTAFKKLYFDLLHSKRPIPRFIEIGGVIFAKHEIKQVAKKLATTYIVVYTYHEPFETIIYCRTPLEQHQVFSNAIQLLTKE